MACFHVFLSFSFLSEHSRFLAVRGKRSVCARLLSVCCAFSFRKWADLQSAEGHIDSVHTCDDVKMKGRGMALIKSRTVAAQCKTEVKGESELSPGSRTFLDCVKCLLVAAGQCSRPSISFCSVLVSSSVRLVKENIEWILLNDTGSEWKGSQHTPAANRVGHATLFHHNTQAYAQVSEFIARISWIWVV